MQKQGRPIRPGGSDNWHAVQVDIPPLPTTISTCRVLALHYMMQVEIVVPRGLDLKTYLPIVIGSIPLRESSQVTRAVAIDSRGNTRPQLDVPVAASIIPTAMPRFTVSNQMINIAGDDDQSALNYAPVYPCAQVSRRVPSAPSSFDEQPPSQDAKEDQPLLIN